MSKYLETKTGSIEEAVLEALQLKLPQVNEGELPPALKAAIAKKKGKKVDDEDDDGKDVAETNKNDKSDDGEGLDAVQPKAVKKKFADRKDKDIDNDGDVDSSDKFLHKRRKAISKSMQERYVTEISRMWGEAADKVSPEDEDGKDKKKDDKDGTTMTGKPLSKVDVAVKSGNS